MHYSKTLFIKSEPAEKQKISEDLGDRESTDEYFFKEMQAKRKQRLLAANERLSNSKSLEGRANLAVVKISAALEWMH